VDGEAPRLVRPEFEDDALPRLYALGDAVFVQGEAVRDVRGGKGDADQVVLAHFDDRGRERVLMRRHRKAALPRLLGVGGGYPAEHKTHEQRRCGRTAERLPGVQGTRVPRTG